MENAIIYGSGEYFKRWKVNLPDDCNVVAYLDSTAKKRSSFTGTCYDGKMIISLFELKDYEYDVIYICSHFIYDMYSTLITVGVEPQKIRTIPVGTPFGLLSCVGHLADSMLAVVGGSVGGVEILLKNPTDFQIVLEIMANGGYHISLPEEEYIVIDIGMNVGIAALFFANQNKISHVYGYEPFADTYQMANDNIDRNPKLKEKITTYNFGLYDRDEEKIIHNVCINPGWRDIRGVEDINGNNQNGRVKYGADVKVVLRDAGREIKRIIDRNQGKKVILKCDTEGSEFSIFDALKRDKLAGVFSAIVLEYHGNPSVIVKYLEEEGYYFLIPQTGVNFGMLYAFK